jgi:hypothetical protein
VLAVWPFRPEIPPCGGDKTPATTTAVRGANPATLRFLGATYQAFLVGWVAERIGAPLVNGVGRPRGSATRPIRDSLRPDTADCELMQTTRTISVGERHRRRSIVVWISLFAFAVQSFAAQIHIHRPLHAVDRTTIVNFVEKAGSHNKSSGTPDTADCPICQAIAHAGAFFIPSAPLLFLPGWVEHVVPSIRLHSVAGAAATHEWFSRGPPRN